MNQLYIKKLEKINHNNIKEKNGLGTIDSASEWLKWLSYEPCFEKNKIKEIERKKAKDLSIDELHELITYKERLEMKKLIINYQDDKCNDEELLKVYNYINKPIDNIVLDKLTKEELEQVKQKMNSINKLTKDELKQMKDNYDKLNMIDSYIIHLALDLKFVNSLGSVNKKI